MSARLPEVGGEHGVDPLAPVSRLVTRPTVGVRDRWADLQDNVQVSPPNLKRLAES